MLLILALEGEFVLYNGLKEIDGTKIFKPYIGSTEELLKRYTAKELEGFKIQVFDFFAKNRDIRMPNRGIAIGFEQLVLRLNNAGENISKANKGVFLSNKINAAIKEIYISEATKWADKNIPNWQEIFKIK
ncbi:hypothetical protein ACI6Q2_07855 [Chitinophagaceae bacterium LWZ2-11]